MSHTASACSAFVALGSNLGDRRAHICRALELLDAAAGIELDGVSTIIETAPVGPGDQGAYLNGVCRIMTSLSARNLLEQLLSIERMCGRRRDPSTRWGPRTLDLDLLIYGETTIDEPGLTVPHPRLADRMFVLRPLAELVPDLVIPGLEESVTELLRQATEGGSPGVSS